MIVVPKEPITSTCRRRHTIRIGKNFRLNFLKNYSMDFEKKLKDAQFRICNFIFLKTEFKSVQSFSLSCVYKMCPYIHTFIYIYKYVFNCINFSMECGVENLGHDWWKSKIFFWTDIEFNTIGRFFLSKIDHKSYILFNTIRL